MVAMTYGGGGDDEEGLLVVTVEVDPKGDYVKLKGGEVEEYGGGGADGGGGGGGGGAVRNIGSASSSSSRLLGCCSGGCDSSSVSRCCSNWWWTLWWWAKLMLLIILIGVLVAVFLKWIEPFFMDKEIIPLINWEMQTFSKPVLAIIVFASMALFPAILLPSTPSMWVAGITFGYGYGFLLIIGGAAIGVSIPYFIGSLFHHKIQGWLKRDPKKASIIKLAGEGNCLNQFRAVTLIRISPFPYVIYNYCAVATDVKYLPYFLGSLLGMVPEVFIALYTGNLIKTLADASHDKQPLSTTQIIFNIVGFCFTVGTTIIITVYSKRRLKELQMEEEPLLQ